MAKKPEKSKRQGTKPRKRIASKRRKKTETLASRLSQLSGWRLWCFRSAAAILVSFVILILIEIGLRIADFGYPTEFFVQANNPKSYTSNSKFGWQFYPHNTANRPHPLLMAEEKQPGVLRIFVLGESAAVGRPDPGFSFGRILETILQRQYPSKRFEVVNAAMRGINSHIILPIAKECAELQPDLFLTYMGNNETIGLYAPEPGKFGLTSYLTALRLSQKLKASKIWQLVEQVVLNNEADGSSDSGQHDMVYFRKQRLAADDPKREVVYENFQRNLNDILKVTRRSGAKVIVSTVAVNVRDSPPLGSLHGSKFSESKMLEWETAYSAGISKESERLFTDAIRHYSAALQIDDRFANLHFRLGRCFLALRNSEKAAKHFTQARDWDAMQFRVDSRMNQLIRKTVETIRNRDVDFVDAARIFAESPLNTLGIQGSELFHEHFLFTFNGNYLLAKSFLPSVVKALNLGAPAAPIPSRQECADSLAYTDWDEFTMFSAMTEITSKPPFQDQIDHAERQKRFAQIATARFEAVQQQDLQALKKTYRNVLAERPNDWNVHFNFGGFLYGMKDFSGAAEQFQFVVNLFPDLESMRMKFGDALAKAGKVDEAMMQFREAIRINPNYRPAYEAMDRVRLRKQSLVEIR